MKLHYMPGACSLSVHISLIWLEVPYELCLVDRNKLKEPEYLKVNPLGKVPALIDGAHVLTEATAVLTYLAEKFSDRNLGASHSLIGRFEFNQWLSHLASNVHPAFYPYFATARYSADPAAHEGIKTAAVKNISLQMQLLEERLKVQTHPLENRKTVIDAYLFVFLRWVKMGLKTLSDYPSLNAFYERMMKDSGVQKALEEEKIS